MKIKVIHAITKGWVWVLFDAPGEIAKGLVNKVIQEMKIDRDQFYLYRVNTTKEIPRVFISASKLNEFLEIYKRVCI